MSSLAQGLRKDGTLISGGASDAVPSFEIREIVGGNRVLILQRNAMPEPPLRFGVSHDLAETRSLGSPYNTQQALGANCMPTTIRGKWCDVFLSQGGADLSEAGEETIDGISFIVIDNRTVRTAREAWAVVEDMCKRGVVIRVSWGHLARIGRIKDATPDWLTLHDVDWEITFNWIGDDETTEVSPPAVVDSATDLRILNEATDKVIEATNYVTSGMDPTVIEVIDTRIARVSQTILDLSDRVRSRVDGVTSALDVFRRSVGVLGLAIDEAKLLGLEIDSRVSGTWLANIDYEDMSNVKPADILSIVTANRIAATAARNIAHEALHRRQATYTSVEEIADIVISREGEDLQTIALAVWGSSDGWQVLRDFNNFTGGTLTPGTVVLIPQRGTRSG
jgi:hypothetical protein